MKKILFLILGLIFLGSGLYILFLNNFTISIIAIVVILAGIFSFALYFVINPERQIEFIGDKIVLKQGGKEFEFNQQNAKVYEFFGEWASIFYIKDGNKKGNFMPGAEESSRLRQLPNYKDMRSIQSIIYIAAIVLIVLLIKFSLF